MNFNVFLAFNYFLFLFLIASNGANGQMNQQMMSSTTTPAPTNMAAMSMPSSMNMGSSNMAPMAMSSPMNMAPSTMTPLSMPPTMQSSAMNLLTTMNMTSSTVQLDGQNSSQPMMPNRLEGVSTWIDNSTLGTNNAVLNVGVPSRGTTNNIVLNIGVPTDEINTSVADRIQTVVGISNIDTVTVQPNSVMPNIGTSGTAQLDSIFPTVSNSVIFMPNNGSRNALKSGGMSVMNAPGKGGISLPQIPSFGSNGNQIRRRRRRRPARRKRQPNVLVVNPAESAITSSKTMLFLLALLSFNVLALIVFLLLKANSSRTSFVNLQTNTTAVPPPIVFKTFQRPLYELRWKYNPWNTNPTVSHTKYGFSKDWRYKPLKFIKYK